MALHKRITTAFPPSSSLLHVRSIRVSTSASSSRWSSVVFLCITLLSLSTLLSPLPADAAPRTHIPAPKSVTKSMGFTFSEKSAQPLQLQIEAQVAGKQQLAYLPKSGPDLDFYYLNYRPSYLAGESQIDFWMVSPKGAKIPKTASLELLDEFGKIRLAVLVPEGTEVPRKIARTHEPFLWKSWTIPKTLPADFDFSDKFRVILRTSTKAAHKGKEDPQPAEPEPEPETAAAAAVTVPHHKRSILEYDAALLNSFIVKAPEPLVFQDRQFRIKGLEATPGGKPNPAKVYVNRVLAAPTNPGAAGGSDANGDSRGIDGKVNSESRDSMSSGQRSRATLPRFMTVMVLLAAVMAPLC
ncbi:hypothetical protein BGZ70_001664 [Mortierella alpina]|uniref:Uncharacterized protein n=1 Tax=Mortierella alpina TaxID=64518 RepID=A0A9P6IVN1_MORAP|nr:hypothetical protein BGZ70_001664 [Mortierella alpina]